MIGANRVRIIGGAWRRRLLSFPHAEGLRPTPDRVRETLFNWLGQTLEGKDCLDVFAGSGALGFEAASRHARAVVMLEKDARAFRGLERSALVLGARNVELRQGDGLEYRPRGRRFDVVFLDPPYASGLLAEALRLARGCLADGGVVYAENGEPLDPGPEWSVWKAGRAGSVHFYLLRAVNEEAR
jgi:16S rRNA (guanine966-N2)-methyltransferase